MLSAIFYIILLVVIGILMPFLGVTNGNKVKDILDRSPQLKVSIYRQTIVTLWVITVLVLVMMYFNNQPLSHIGAEFILDHMLMTKLLIVCIGYLGLVNLVNLSASSADRLKQLFHRVLYIIPVSKKEYRWSILLSFTAGFCEEIIFRGFLYEQANMYMPEFMGLIVVNIIFALCHWGTGYKNALWSFALGVIWSVIYLKTGSLWIPVLMHILIDITSMTFGRKLLMQQKVQSTAKSR
ncbi:MAG: hypothetical protein DHS20C17_24690 [Cyclobacteriaceae bacterium]|nr:MAG: hypothetical protein DHS20C17_24690 [Cyclobacteriaceae bacterium]